MKEKLYKSKWIKLKMIDTYEMVWGERYGIYRAADNRYFVDVADGSPEVAFVIATENEEEAIVKCIENLKALEDDLK